MYSGLGSTKVRFAATWADPLSSRVDVLSSRARFCCFPSSLLLLAVLAPDSTISTEGERSLRVCASAFGVVPLGAVLKHNSSHCRFSARAHPPRGGSGGWFDHSGGAVLHCIRTPWSAGGGGGWGVAKIAENRQNF
jgi:hypothetical protein